MKYHLAATDPGTGTILVLCGHKVRNKGNDLRGLVTSFRDIPEDERCYYCERQRQAAVAARLAAKGK